MNDRPVKREDIDRFRQALTELGGEATLEQIATHTGETEHYYIVACLVIPVPSAQDPSLDLPFAVPCAWDRSIWRTEQHWTVDDLEAAVEFLGKG